MIQKRDHQHGENVVSVAANVIRNGVVCKCCLVPFKDEATCREIGKGRQKEEPWPLKSSTTGTTAPQSGRSLTNKKKPPKPRGGMADAADLKSAGS